MLSLCDPIRRLSGPQLRRRPWGLAMVIAFSLALAACGAPSEPRPLPSARASALAVSPRIVRSGADLQCVPYARRISQVTLRGDADTWWGQAAGRYARGKRPQAGSVLVLKPRGRSRGHVAVVTAVLSDREIVVDHANWLNRGDIHLDTPVIDVSRAGDWSAVKVWYTPGGVYGVRTYPAHGFIHPPAKTAAQ